MHGFNYRCSNDGYDIKVKGTPIGVMCSRISKTFIDKVGVFLKIGLVESWGLREVEFDQELGFQRN